MRAPPPIHVDIDAGPGWRAARCLLVAGAVGVPLAWVAPRWMNSALSTASTGVASDLREASLVEVSHPLAGWLLAAAIAVAIGASRWRRLGRQAQEAPGRRLRWDGEGWSLRVGSDGAPLPGRVALVLDLGGWMLVRFQAESARGMPGDPWLALRRSADPSGWCALRTALWNWRAEPRAADR